MNTETALGYDVVQAIDPASYEITRTGDDVGYARRFDADRKLLERALEQAFPSAETTEVHPGYLRVRTPADFRDRPNAAAEKLGEVAATFNNLEATPAPDGDGYLDALQFGATYTGVYRPDTAGGVEDFVDRHLDRDEYPDREQPVIEWSRDVPPGAAGGGGRHVAYELCLLLDPSMYEDKRGFATDHSGFRWGEEHAEQFAQNAKRYLRRWSHADVGEVTVWPTHIRLEAHVGNTATTPEQLLQSAAGVIRRCLAGEPLVPLDYTAPGFVAALEAADRSGDAWIEHHNLDAVTGEPYDPEPAPEPDDPEPDQGGTGWGALNPFGG